MAIDHGRVATRAARILREHLEPRAYGERVGVTIEQWVAPHEPVSFVLARDQRYEAVAAGAPWGRPWGTTWFRVSGAVPGHWTAGPPELVVDLGFLQGRDGFQAEGLAFAPDGRILKGVEPNSRHVPVDAQPGSDFTLFVEAASNPDFAIRDFAPTPLGSLATAGDTPLYQLGEIFLGLRDLEVWQLIQEVVMMVGAAEVLPPSSTRRAELLEAIIGGLDLIDPQAVAASARPARQRLGRVLTGPAYASAHRVSAVGHAHIDSAWLWPVRETVRKCARTFSNVVALMDEDPELMFACSSAQQYAWVRDHYPDLFARIAQRVRDGRFVPVGGMWVESDTNMPSGESLIRQFLLGKTFFEENFGVDPVEVWLPDSFGYSAALPQIAQHLGCRYLLTQKLSWNDTNDMPYSTFWWEGIDGTRLFTHFPPIGTYNSDLSAGDLHASEVHFKQRAQARHALVPFGYGDGGGGPTREMMAAARLTSSFEGLPAVEVTTPRAFFDQAREELSDPPVWQGELYLEKHRGTYTSQARLKQGNRRCESLLHEAELWATTAMVRAGARYPYDELRHAWELVLLNQFHDILPGSSINWVNTEAAQQYADLEVLLEELIGRSLGALVGPGDRQLVAQASPLLPASSDAPLGVHLATGESADVTVTMRDGDAVLESPWMELVLDREGRFVSLMDRTHDRELIPSGCLGNDLQLFTDLPAEWDAWDIDEDYRRAPVITDRHPRLSLLDDGRGVRVTSTLGRSEISQEIRLAAGRPAVEIATSVDWREHQRMLKLAFPLNIHATSADSEIQFGHVTRSILSNTSWDTARFEMCAHRWVRVGEAGYEVAIANRTTYGHDVTRTPAADGSTATVVRQTLLRSALFPDPSADRDRHSFTTVLRAGALGAAAAAEGHFLNLPPRFLSGGAAADPLVRTSTDQIVVETVKAAEDRSGDVVIRLYEATGGHGHASITCPGLTDLRATDGLERPVAADWLQVDHATARLQLRPFQLITLRATPLNPASNPREERH